jgi:hypothetical protein
VLKEIKLILWPWLPNLKAKVMLSMTMAAACGLVSCSAERLAISTALRNHPDCSGKAWTT